MFEEYISLERSGQVIVVKPMDPGYILDACPAVLGNRPIAPGVTPGNHALRRLHELLMLNYGNCAILAWEADRVVGFATFYPDGLIPPQVEPVCPATLEGAPETVPVVSTSLLQLGCLHVVDRPSYRNKGVANKLVEVLLHWAQFNGWQAVKVKGPCFSGMLPEHWDERQPPFTFWRKHGFIIAGVSSDEETKAYRRDFVKEHGFPAERLAFTSKWRRVFGRYELIRFLGDDATPIDPDAERPLL